MCRGIHHQERNNQGSSCSKEVVSSTETSRLVFCELCGSRASLYCQADDAFLCRKCDRWVHGANFLARRHVRCMLCNSCQNLTQRYLIGASTEVLLPTIINIDSFSRRRHDSKELPVCNDSSGIALENSKLQNAMCRSNMFYTMLIAALSTRNGITSQRIDDEW
ncbi:hypothetical protein SADUNF_Sadunf07G0104000 [Salix dunnii]|uniref:B box-type domain-containing protein n=1 Tax=Salix dunnii TaxID=1413687 RepID=A0A835K480_9ROSI|nr:hypothetical protein SADUNF_Sadunf07G0104000 [Salix dunnii]